MGRLDEITLNEPERGTQEFAWSKHFLTWPNVVVGASVLHASPGLRCGDSLLHRTFSYPFTDSNTLRWHFHPPSTRMFHVPAQGSKSINLCTKSDTTAVTHHDHASFFQLDNTTLELQGYGFSCKLAGLTRTLKSFPSSIQQSATISSPVIPRSPNGYGLLAHRRRRRYSAPFSRIG